MRNYCYILFILLTSCATVKKSHMQQTIVTKDSVVHDIQLVHDTFVHQVLKEVHDTVIRIKMDTVRLDLKKGDLQPLILQNGTKLGRHYSANNGNAHAIVDVDTFGNVSVKCNTDSLQLVINNITREKDSLYSSFDSMRSANESIKNSMSSTTIDKTVKRTPFWIFIIVFSCGIVTPYVIKFLFKTIKYHV